MRLRLALVMAVVCSAAGCPFMDRTRILHPGNIQTQEAVAKRFDPFPMTDAGPDMQARPLAYIRPAPENERIQNDRSFQERYHQPAPPGIYKPPRELRRPQSISYIPGQAPLPGATTGLTAPPAIALPSLPIQ